MHRSIPGEPGRDDCLITRRPVFGSGALEQPDGENQPVASQGPPYSARLLIDRMARGLE